MQCDPLGLALKIPTSQEYMDKLHSPNWTKIKLFVFFFSNWMSQGCEKRIPKHL